MKINHKDEAPRLIGTGAACVGAECDLMVPESFSLEYLGCYFDIDAQQVTVAGGASATITMNPTTFSFFSPVAIALSVKDNVDPQLNQNIDVTAVNIRGCALEGFNDGAPTAATTQAIDSELWNPLARSGCACPVCWDCYSNAANSRQLTITVFNRNPAGTTARAKVAIYGRGILMLPADCANPRKPPFRRVPPLTGGSGTLVGVGQNGRGSAVPL